MQDQIFEKINAIQKELDESLNIYKPEPMKFEKEPLASIDLDESYYPKPEPFQGESIKIKF